MKPPSFDYVRATTLAEAHAVLAAEGNAAQIVAGGQTLLPLLSMRLARPKVLVDIMRLGELTRLQEADGAIHVGAAVRQADLLAFPGLAARQRLLSAALPLVGHAQTRSRGTVCGSMAHADPSAELPLVLVALGGTVSLSSRRRRRTLAAEAFFKGAMATARRQDELVAAVAFPTAKPGYGYAFREFARRHGDFAIVACAAIANEREARLAIGGVADRPVAFDGLPLDGTALDVALDRIAGELDARDDLHASVDYRRHLVRRLGRATIAEASRCRA